MTHVAIELPEEIASRLGEPGDLSRVALEALAAASLENWPSALDWGLVRAARAGYGFKLPSRGRM
jgi:hypothetical protein